jgi:hypothetical protein
MTLTFMELAAILKAGHIIISADGINKEEEFDVLAHEMNVFRVPQDRINDLIRLSLSMDVETMVSTLSALDEEMKRHVCGFLAAIMMSDGDVDENELQLWHLISVRCAFPSMSINDAISFWAGEQTADQGEPVSPVIKALIQGSNNPAGLLFDFKSSDHIRYENGRDVSGHNYNCHRTVRIQKDIKGRRGYTVSVLNDDGVHPLWGDNVQVAPKPMRIVSTTENEIELRGYGEDDFGTSFADYGLTLVREGDMIKSCILHMFDRNVDIEYL